MSSWQDVVVWGIVAAALFFLVRRFWPRSRRPDVPTSSLVRKRDAKEPPHGGCH